MIIEQTVREYMISKLDCPVWMEIPKGVIAPEQYVLIQKVGSQSRNHVEQARLAIQSHADSMMNAAQLNEEVISAMKGLSALDAIGRVTLGGDYNFTNTQTKKYRYQAYFEITYYREV